MTVNIFVDQYDHKLLLLSLSFVFWVLVYWVVDCNILVQGISSDISIFKKWPLKRILKQFVNHLHFTSIELGRQNN